MVDKEVLPLLVRPDVRRRHRLELVQTRRTRNDLTLLKTIFYMIQLEKIKLIIWDLDDTFWCGTISEEGYSLPDVNVKLVKDLTDAGIINSICSKNDYDTTKAELVKLGLWDYFVFASINWENKGKRIESIIDRMALRPVNVLFIDDNTFNIQEAKYYLPELQVAMPEVIPNLIAQLDKIAKKDISHKRLKQYKVLEEKAIVAESFDSNEEFLFSSNIQVQIQYDCLTKAERLHELLLRTNQLNYTKRRISFEDLLSILQNPSYHCGYVTVTDNFGDYGIVGFFAETHGRLEHFLFSCRTMGQMIEQWVYAQLHFPELEVIGEVRTQLNKTDCPKWINQDIALSKNDYSTQAINCKILLKGPCDLSNAQSYLNLGDAVVSEFTYVKQDTGQVIDTHNHSLHIRGLLEYSDIDKQVIVNDCAFVDPEMLQGTFFKEQYDVIFLSSLIESVYHIYQKKNSLLQVVYRASLNPELDEKFLEQYSVVGFTSPKEYEEFLVYCLDKLPKSTTLCIILGSTLSLPHTQTIAMRHKQINEVVMKIAVANHRLRYIRVDDFIKSERDITDNINHYQTRIYYEIAQEMLRVIKDVTGQQVARMNKGYIVFDAFLKKMKPVVKSIFSYSPKLLYISRQVYWKLTRRKSNIK